ncbi:MAG: hypothetical protein L0Z62_21995, partial [Gemmataceae bacterium]|nr:hypothetical protein [Gemmataceae bacterium]
MTELRADSPPSPESSGRSGSRTRWLLGLAVLALVAAGLFGWSVLRRERQGIDDTIVNPRHLSRDLAEAVCQQCHLMSSFMVVARGRKLAAFRPGLPLHDVRIDFRLHEPEAPMTVTGHVEQLHLSRCYQASGTLTCMTCHNPHVFPETDPGIVGCVESATTHRDTGIRCLVADST